MFDADPELTARYLDHGATSFPKPACVSRAMAEYIDGCGGTYGRAAYDQAARASRIVYSTRQRLARAIGAGDPSRLALTLNATHACNIAIQGLARPGGTVLVSALEHNSVMRPSSLMAARRGVRVEVMPAGPDGAVDPERLEPGPEVCLAVVSLVSNVNGARQPIEEIAGRLGKIPLLVDAAQAAGEVRLSVEEQGLDLVALSGHKGLLGPSGTGALWVRPGLELPTLLPGGTGSRSESIEQPTAMPDSLESGTPNLAGIAGLDAALEFGEQHGPGEAIGLAREAIERLGELPGVAIHAAADPERRTSLFSFEVEGMDPGRVAGRLFAEGRIAVRAGLHCSPSAHRWLGTFERGGTVRVGFGRFQTSRSVDLLVDAVSRIVKGR
ncbi:MAG: aminotransferase class V-fold PLP-dependent enzyme [Polyangia bacterium]